MARYPGATWRPVARYLPGGSSNRPMDRYDVGVDHTEVSDWSADAAFNHYNTPGNATPHFRFNKDGTVLQLIDTEFRSSAVLDGNHRAITWETWDGFPDAWTGDNAPLDTSAIVEAKARLMVWVHVVHGIPLVRVPTSKPDARGMGWHRLGIDGNFPQPPGELLGGRVDGGEHWSTSFGKGCPTDTRIRQFVAVTLPRAIDIAQGDDVTPQELRDELKAFKADLFATLGNAKIGNPAHPDDPTVGQWSVETGFATLYSLAHDALDRVNDVDQGVAAGNDLSRAIQSSVGDVKILAQATLDLVQRIEAGEVQITKDAVVAALKDLAAKVAA